MDTKEQKVYVVWWDGYGGTDGGEIYGVFSTRQQAEEWCDTNNCHPDNDIKEMLLNKGAI